MERDLVVTVEAFKRGFTNAEAGCLYETDDK